MPLLRISQPHGMLNTKVTCPESTIHTPRDYTTIPSYKTQLISQYLSASLQQTFWSLFYWYLMENGCIAKFVQSQITNKITYNFERYLKSLTMDWSSN